MCAILLAFILICAAGDSFAVDVARCSNGTQSQLTLTPHDDGVVGRYLAEMCTDLEPETTAWKLTLTFYDNDYRCKHPPLSGIHRPGKVHSTYDQTIALADNCSHVCLNTTFDLIFTACYAIESFFTVNGYTRHITYTYFNIKNNYTKEYFMANKALYDVYYEKNFTTIVWHTGVPFEDFDVSICKILNDTADIIDQETCMRAGAAACAAPAPAELRCRAALPPACYELLLTLHATWTHGTFRDQGLVKHKYCKPAERVAAAVGSSAAWAWAACGAAALCGACGAARLACRTRDARRLHKAVLREWLVHRNEPSPASPPDAEKAPEKAPRRTVLLLYAREGPATARLAATLREMLEHAPDTQVYDIFSPEVLSLAAAAPGAWVRGLVARADVVVLLLQTPALAALYRAPLADQGGTFKLAAPLLGRRVVYRAPQYGDTLLQYALQLAGEAPRAQADYRKYYVATLSALPTEAFPCLTPFRRYQLPGAAALLARDVTGAEPPRAAAAALARAAADLADLAAERPDYLLDELLFI